MYLVRLRDTSSDSVYTYEIHKLCKVCACVGFLLDCYGYCVHSAKCFPGVTENSKSLQPFERYVDNSLIHANVWESMGSKPCSYTQVIKSRIFYYKSCENPYQNYKSRENPYQVLQVTCVCLNVQ